MITRRIRDEKFKSYTVGDAWKDIDTALNLTQFAFMVRAINQELANDLVSTWRSLLPAGLGVVSVTEKPVKRRSVDVERTMKTYADESGPTLVYKTDTTRLSVDYIKFRVHKVNPCLKFKCDKKVMKKLKEVF